jgi:hypothetical protein
MREDLVGYLLGALDDDAAQQIERKLSEKPDLRDELNRIGAALRPLSHDADVDPPAGLAARTVRRVLTTQASDQWAPASTWRLTDLAIAASILFTISMILLPAINESRQHRALVDCSYNLHTIGVALESYSSRQGGYLPYYSAEGPLAIGGIYAPILIDSQFILDRSVFTCPSSGDKPATIYSLGELRAAEADIAQLSSMVRNVGGSYGSLLGFRERGVYKSPRSDRLIGQSILADRGHREGEGDVGQSNSPNHGGFGQNALCRDGSVKFFRHPEECPGCDNFYVSLRNRVEPGLTITDNVLGSGDARISNEDDCEQF